MKRRYNAFNGIEWSFQTSLPDERGMKDLGFNEYGEPVNYGVVYGVIYGVNMEQTRSP